MCGSRVLGAVAMNDEPTCEHGRALDVHCCNCHSGFLFDMNECVCVFDDPAFERWDGWTILTMPKNERPKIARHALASLVATVPHGVPMHFAETKAIDKSMGPVVIWMVWW